MSLWRSGPQVVGEYGLKPEVSLRRHLEPLVPPREGRATRCADQSFLGLPGQLRKRRRDYEFESDLLHRRGTRTPGAKGPGRP
jgi:hypothetical protein